MDKTQARKMNLTALAVFGIAVGLIMSALYFMPNRELDKLNKLEASDYATTTAVSTGGVERKKTGGTKRGNREGYSEYCTSWRWSMEGQSEQFWTDETDCYGIREDAPNGTEGTLIYNPEDTSMIAVNPEKTRERIKSQQSTMKIAGLIGMPIAVISVIGLIFVRKRA